MPPEDDKKGPEDVARELNAIAVGCRGDFVTVVVVAKKIHGPGDSFGLGDLFMTATHPEACGDLLDRARSALAEHRKKTEGAPVVPDLETN